MLLPVTGISTSLKALSGIRKCNWQPQRSVKTLTKEIYAIVQSSVARSGHTKTKGFSRRCEITLLFGSDEDTEVATSV